MKVKSTTKPETVSVQKHSQIDNFLEVRLRENIEQQDNVFVYDEYVLAVPTQENLEEEIKNNLADWLKTGREQEASEQASTVQDMLKMLHSIVLSTKQQKEQQKQIEEMQNAIAEVFESINAN